MTLLTLPRASIPVIDSKGYMSREWYRWATDATARMGGVEGASTDDLNVSQFEDAGIEEAKAGLYRMADEFGQVPPAAPMAADRPPEPEIESLRAEVAELRKAIEALQQGITP